MLEAALIQEAQRASVVEVRAERVRYATPDWVKPVTPQCVVEEANRQSLEVVKVLAVMKTEGGRLGEYSRNSNGSFDIGPMQVNTIHLPELSKIYAIAPADVSQLLAYDGCFNVAVGAWLLRKRTNEAAGDFWYGIGRYHSSTRLASNKYILRVHGMMLGIVKTADKHVAPTSLRTRAQTRDRLATR